MALDYAKSFYASTEWHKVSTLYMSSKNYICERCGKPGVICHHKKYIRPSNINDPYITLNQDNLECLCIECHNTEHKPKHSVTYFDDEGNVERVRETKELKELAKDRANIDDVIARARQLQAKG